MTTNKAKERPILFNGDQVRAILSGQKTQTRRALKQQPAKNGSFWEFPWGAASSLEYMPVVYGHASANACPFGKVGDRLWGKEAFEYGLCTKTTIAYRATHQPSDLEEGWLEPIKWKPSIHMPRNYSRITLEITAVRVERLQAISEADAIAEGFDNSKSEAAVAIGWYEKPKAAFRRLWESSSRAESWDANPWVWVIEFKRINQA